jgi:hypothetical protein
MTITKLGAAREGCGVAQAQRSVPGIRAAGAVRFEQNTLTTGG